MVSVYISPDCVAVLFDGKEISNIRQTVASCLIDAGCTPWREMEAELYSLNGCSLLIARPRPPLRERLIGCFPRLCR